MKPIYSGSDAVQVAMTTAATKLRGHAAYWDRVKSELKAHIAVFGPPSWFVTLNPAESDWTEVLAIYQEIYGLQVTPSNIRDYVAKDPFFFCRHFQQRVRAMFSDIVLQPSGPLGNINHFMFRIEYQMRGTEHVHCVLWDSKSPKKNATDKDILQYISSHVTARMPDQLLEPALHKIIVGHQKHWDKHSKTCTRKFKFRGKIYTKCRFEFPRPALATARMNHAAEQFIGIPGSKAKPYSLARKAGEEQMINDYCPAISLAWKANTDVQYVFSDLHDIVSYICGYSTKSESSKEGGSVQATLREAMTSTDCFKAMMDLIRMRETGVLEMVDMLMGHSMFEFDAGHIFINTNSEDKRHRFLLPKSKMSKGNEKVYKENTVDEYYPKRNSGLEQVSFFSLMIQFTSDKEPAKKSDDDDVTPSTGSDPDGYHRSGNPYLHHANIDSPFSPFHHHAALGNQIFPILGHGPNGKCHRRLNKPLVPRLFWPHLEAVDEVCLLPCSEAVFIIV